MWSSSLYTCKTGIISSLLMAFITYLFWSWRVLSYHIDRCLPLAWKIEPVHCCCYCWADGAYVLPVLCVVSVLAEFCWLWASCWVMSRVIISQITLVEAYLVHMPSAKSHNKFHLVRKIPTYLPICRYVHVPMMYLTYYYYVYLCK